jgi:hypothetical protein
VLLSTPLHASSNFTLSVQLANKRGFTKKKKILVFAGTTEKTETISQAGQSPGQYLNLGLAIKQKCNKKIMWKIPSSGMWQFVTLFHRNLLPQA